MLRNSPSVTFGDSSLPEGAFLSTSDLPSIRAKSRCLRNGSLTISPGSYSGYSYSGSCSADSADSCSAGSCSGSDSFRGSDSDSFFIFFDLRSGRGRLNFAFAYASALFGTLLLFAFYWNLFTEKAAYSVKHLRCIVLCHRWSRWCRSLFKIVYPKLVHCANVAHRPFGHLCHLCYRFSRIADNSVENLIKVIARMKGDIEECNRRKEISRKLYLENYLRISY